MKTYDDSVRLHVLKMDLESEHSDKIRSNEQILARRWKKTETALRKAYPLVRKIYRQLGDELADMLKSIDFDYSKLNKYVTPKVKRYVEDRIESWSAKGLNKGYLAYAVNSHTWTYKSVLKLLILGLYAEKFKQIKTVSNDVFTVSAVDVYTQSVRDRNFSYFPLLSYSAILALATMPVLQTTYVEYLDGVMLLQADEMNSFVLVDQMQSIEINMDALFIRLVKQCHRIIKVKDDKFSGGLDDATRAVANGAYVFETPEDQKVRFVAEMDEKTTKMCRSLNDQIFFVHKENVFKRYSAENDAMVEVRCNGLVQGLNMPPITDHFHWCRSTLTYQIQLSAEEVRNQM